MAQVFPVLCSSQWSLLLQFLSAYYLSLLVLVLMEHTGYCGVHILRARVPLEHTKIYLGARDSHDLGCNHRQCCNFIHYSHEKGGLWTCGTL